MSEFEDDFKFFRDAIECIPGEADTVMPSAPQNLSRNELQARLDAKIQIAQAKNSKVPDEPL